MVSSFEWPSHRETYRGETTLDSRHIAQLWRNSWSFIAGSLAFLVSQSEPVCLGLAHRRGALPLGREEIALPVFARRHKFLNLPDERKRQDGAGRLRRGKHPSRLGVGVAIAKAALP